MLDKIVNAIDEINTRLTDLEKKVSSQPSAPNPEATPRKQHPNGDWVYDVSGLKQTTDKNTGEPGFWVKTKNGKNALVDVLGYVIWDDERPIKFFNGNVERATSAVQTPTPF